jgi:hypothetical protein
MISEAALDHISVLAGVLAMLEVLCGSDNGLYFPPTKRQPPLARA